MISLVLLIVALICFLIGAANPPIAPRLNFISLGLAFWVLSLILGGSYGHLVH